MSIPTATRLTSGPTAWGRSRARYRVSDVKCELIVPGKIYKYNLDLWHTAIALAPGHRLRVEVASAAFPTFSRNLNTGGDNQTETKFVSATQTIYHDADHPSHILLPFIPDN
ncbi:MAG TPA: CocE/NonD family hydrolase [Bryobacteraceae bacterium]|nr:CocE/NonD family hydrolase [Bryobacteraceae bacterium]